MCDVQGLKCAMQNLKEKIDLLEVRMMSMNSHQHMGNLLYDREQALERHRISFERQHGYMPPNDSGEDEID